MTVSSNTTRQLFTCNGVTTARTANFRVITASQLRVVLYTIATGATVDLVGSGTDYTVTSAGGATTDFSTTTAYSSAYKIIALLNMPLSQETDYVANDSFPAESHEAALDKLTLIAQQFKDQLSRAALLPEFSATNLSVVLPTPTDGYGVVWDGSTGTLRNTTVSLATLETQAAALYAIRADITTVAGISANVTSVAGNASNINTVAGIAAAVSTVAGISGAVSAVSANASNINTVAGISANVTTVAGISGSVTTVAGIQASVTTVAGISTQVTGVYNIRTDVTTVAGISSAVSNVSSISAAVSTVSGISANVTTVAGVASSVPTVAGISANVTTVAGIATAISTLAAISSDVTAAANNIPKANRTATTNPGVGNDNTQNYSAGSLWINTTGPSAWMAMSVATGAAVWQQLTASSTSLSSLGDVNITSIGNKDFLVYDTGGSKWRNRTPANARGDLGVAIGSDVQAYSATLAAVAGGTYTGASSITTLGTIATGVWNGTKVSEVYGGTNQASYTQGDILYASAANTLSKLAAGTSGQFLKTQGAGANPLWGDVASQLVLIATATASASASLDFTSLISSSYDYYIFTIRNIICASSCSFRVKFSADNGSTWTAGMNWQKALIGIGGSTSPSLTGGTSPAELTQGSSTNFAGKLELYMPTLTGSHYVGMRGNTMGDGGNMNEIYIATNSGSSINAVQFLASTGNITSGSIQMFGVKNT